MTPPRRTPASLVALVGKHAEALGLCFRIAYRTRIDHHAPERTLRQGPDPVALFRGVLLALQDVRERLQEVKLRRIQGDALRVELFERLGWVDKASLNDLLAAVRRGKTLLLVP